MNVPAATAAVTGPFRAHGHAFRVRCDDPALGDWIRNAFCMLIDDSADVVVSADYEIRSGDADRFSLSWGDELLAAHVGPGRIVGTLAWHINRCVVDAATTEHVVLHAAAASRDGRALLLPAEMESGKTTLVAGLVDRGWQYLTDEAAAIPLGSTIVHPYLKPLSIDPGSHAVLPHWRPDTPPGLDVLARGQWQVPAIARGDDRAGGACPVAGIVFPRYEADAATVLTPIGRATALAQLATTAFQWDAEDLRDRFLTLSAVVRQSAAAELVTGDLDDACAAIEQWWCS